MGKKCEWPCWKIMDCAPSRKCPAKNNREKPCWEIAREENDYRHAFNICSDCIVYLLKVEGSILTLKGKKAIMTHKAK